VLRALGFLAIAVALIAVFLAIASWPPGGLMFAAPYLFLLIGAVFGAVGAGLVLLARPRRRSRPADPEHAGRP
jgi:hypothetical protein